MQSVKGSGTGELVSFAVLLTKSYGYLPSVIGLGLNIDS